METEVYGANILQRLEADTEGLNSQVLHSELPESISHVLINTA